MCSQALGVLNSRARAAEPKAASRQDRGRLGLFSEDRSASSHGLQRPRRDSERATCPMVRTRPGRSAAIQPTWSGAASGAPEPELVPRPLSPRLGSVQPHSGCHVTSRIVHTLLHTRVAPFANPQAA